MSEEGETICPLCAEEMDLTDQQLKPCKCGYEICVWCWHHIIEMAEKQNIEGRCPACRVVYDKDRIVGMSSNCERLVAESNGDKKSKSQKSKTKSTAEARKHLGSVRVIQRNLVYIIGLPLNVCDANVLERKEYFGQYGKVLKVSISRPTTGSQQTPSSNTFNVYITFGKEEEAVRCIQAVHNFVLEGKQLRACFGTTKYCHAWLRNMPCTNPDCFYLHDVGSQEDSFTKDEIISAYTRSRVPQIIINNSQRRLGNILPPPADDLNNVAKASGKSAVKNSSNISATSVKSVPTSSSLARSNALPAAALWGAKLAHSAASVPCVKASSKQKQENPLIPVTVSNSKQPHALHKDLADKGKNIEKVVMKSKDDKIKPDDLSKPSMDVDLRVGLNLPSDLDYVRQTSAWHDDDALPSAVVQVRNLASESNGKSWSLEGIELCIDRDVHKMASASSAEISFSDNILSSWDEDDNDDVLSLPKTIEGKEAEHPSDIKLPIELTISSLTKDSESEVSDSSETTIEPTYSSDIAISSSSHVDDKKVIFPESTTEFTSGPTMLDALQTHVHNDLIQDTVQTKEKMQMVTSDLTSLNINSDSVKQGKDMPWHESSSSGGVAKSPGMQTFYPEIREKGLSSLDLNESSISAERRIANGTSDWTWNLCKKQINTNVNAVEYSLDTLDIDVNGIRHGNPSTANQAAQFPSSRKSTNVEENQRNIHGGDYHNTRFSGDPMWNARSTNISASFIHDTGYDNHDVRSNELDCLSNYPNSSNFNKIANTNMRESHIISNILSMDVNPWDMSSPTDYTKLLGETDEQHDALSLSSLLKGKNHNQSRFSFARVENPSDHLGPFSNEPSLLNRDNRSLEHGLAARNLDVSSSRYLNGSTMLSPAIPKVKAPVKTSAPPGFFFPRVPPPGFASQNRLDVARETPSVTTYQTPGSSISSNPYQTVQGGNNDIEFIDPAILAVGREKIPSDMARESMLHSFTPQMAAFENIRSRQLLQQQQTSLQNGAISGLVGNMYIPSKNAYDPSQIIHQNNGSLSHFSEILSSSPLNMHTSNNQWGAWNDVHAINGIHLRNDFKVLESIRKERFGLNKYFPGSEEPDFVYNQAFGM